MLEESQKVKVTNQKANYFWVAGFMFTFGIGAFDFVATTFWESLWQLIVAFACWPMFLGLHFA